MVVASARLRTLPHSLLVAALMCVITIAACSEGPTEPLETPLTGLSRSGVADSIGNMPPGAPVASAPGFFRGTVLGPSAPGAGNDSLASAPRVAGVVVTAYPVMGGTEAAPELGDAAATATTGADGRFTLATLPGGAYVVTVHPPASSAYGGVWVTAIAHASSHEHAWWVVLPVR